MGKRKQPKRKSGTKSKVPSPAPPPPAPQKGLIKTVEWAVGILASVLTIAGFVLSNAPKLSVDASESVASFSPMGTIFYLSNEGLLPIHNVVVSCANLRIDGENLQILGPWEFTNVPPEAKADVLSPGHRMSLPYAPAFGFTAINNFKGAQVTIIVRYRPAYLWWRKTEAFPFRAVRTVNGGWIWKSVPQ
jgi:hypothetical protein